MRLSTRRFGTRLELAAGAVLLLALLIGLLGQVAPSYAQEGICDAAPEPRLSLGHWAIVTDLVTDTAAGGLRMRATPFISGEEVAVLPAGTYGQVIDGPACNDGFWWWSLTIPELGVEGWSAEGYGLAYYLAPVAAPAPTETPVITPIPQETPEATEPPPTEAATEAVAAGGTVEVTAGGGFSPVARFTVETADALAVSADGGTVALAQADRIIVFDGADLTLLTALVIEGVSPTAIALSPDGATLLAGYDNGDVAWWDVASSQIARNEEAAGAGTSIVRVAYSPDGVTIAAADSAGRVVLYDDDVFTVRVAEPLPVGTEAAVDIRGLAFSPDGTQLLIGALRPAGDLGRVSLYALATLVSDVSTQGPYGSGQFISSQTVLLDGNATTPASLWTPASGLLTSLPGTEGQNAVVPRPNDTLLA
ncbi:MAG: hypothetical protein JW910_11130, partial [Anaerolineae bacterium]|nr:hypothetical protein [Anaerolineae bacterium]